MMCPWKDEERALPICKIKLENEPKMQANMQSGLPKRST